jgi:hypothetical protein
MRKNILRIAGVFTLVLAIFAISTAFKGKETKEMSSKNSCTVYVKYSSGSAAEGIKIVGDVCGGISCVGQTPAVYTDKDGKATIEWSDGCKLCYIYVKGTSHKGEYENGKTYNFTL